VRGMHCSGCVIEEKRLVRRDLFTVSEEANGFIGDVLCYVVTFLWPLGGLNTVIVIGQVRIVLVGPPPRKP
jgi:hypothetical protein